MAAVVTIRQERSSTGITLKVTGRLTAGRGVEELFRRVGRLVARGARILTLDLRSLRLIDCSGIGLLVRCQEAARRRGAILRVAGARGPVRTMLRLSALLDRLEAGVHESQDVRGRSGHDAPLLLSA